MCGNSRASEGAAEWAPATSPPIATKGARPCVQAIDSRVVVPQAIVAEQEAVNCRSINGLLGIVVEPLFEYELNTYVGGLDGKIT